MIQEESLGKERLIIIDSNSIIHRAFHALPPLTTKRGELINAVYGFLLVFFKVLRELQPKYIVACFDFPGRNFRHEQFKEYKAKRPPIPEELCQQILRVKEVLKAFQVQVFEKEGFEADDIIGTISKKATEVQNSTLKSRNRKDLETVIISGDLDVLQVVNSQTRVYFLRKGVKDVVLYDVNEIEKKYGILPSQFVDFKALRGDPSDNIPGVKGIGEKGAIEIIKNFGSLENLYKELEQGSVKTQALKPRIKEILAKQKKQAFFSKMLVSIKEDVPIDFSLEHCQWKGYNKEKVINLFKDLEFLSLIEKLP
jgi:DNA polymerase-1